MNSRDDKNERQGFGCGCAEPSKCVICAHQKSATWFDGVCSACGEYLHTCPAPASRTLKDASSRELLRTARTYLLRAWEKSGQGALGPISNILTALDAELEGRTPSSTRALDAAQIALDQQSDDPPPGSWNDACRHIAHLIREAERAERLRETPSAIGAWISVEERKPEVGQNVLSWSADEGLHIDCYDTWHEQPAGPAVGGSLECGPWFQMSDYPTHWMPLPELPAVPLNTTESGGTK